MAAVPLREVLLELMDQTSPSESNAVAVTAANDAMAARVVETREMTGGGSCPQGSQPTRNERGFQGVGKYSLILAAVGTKDRRDVDPEMLWGTA
jgi:hypothetical protein